MTRPFLVLNDGVQRSVVVMCPPCEVQDVGSSPAATMNEKRTLGDSFLTSWPNGPTGSEWKTGDVKPN